MRQATQNLIKSHVERHGYKCVVSHGKMAICVPIAKEGRLVGHQLVRVTDLKHAYIAMGY